VNPTRARRSLLAAGLGLLIVAGMVAERLAVLARAAPSDFDDAYMYLRYVGNLLDGHGLAWNPGEGSVFGVTSLLHLAVLAKLRWCLAGLGAAGLLRVASGSAAVALVFALAGMLAVHARHPRLRGNWIFWLAVILPVVAYREAFVFHASTGMDTMLSALANAFVVCAALRLAESPKLSTVLAAALVSVLAVLARPDNLLCALFCPALALGLLAPPPRRKRLAVFLGLAVGGVAIVAAVEWLGLGSPVPLSFFAKQPWYYGGFAGEFTWNPFLFLKVFCYSAWPFLVALILFADRAGWRRAAVLLAPALASMAVFFRFNQIMGHLGRFYYPFLPFFVAAGALEFDAWLARGRTLHPKTVQRRVLFAAALLLAGSLALALAARAYEARAQAHKLVPFPGGFQVRAQAPLPDIDSWQAAQAIAAIAVAAPRGASFATSEHGLPSALAPQVTFIDVLGLHDPYFARYGFSAEDLFRRRPDFIWLPHEDHTQMLHDILTSDAFWSDYVFYPDAFFHGIALRREGANYERLVALVSAQWQGVYPGFTMSDYEAVRGE